MKKGHLSLSNRRGTGSTAVVQIFNKMSRSSTTSLITDIGGQPQYSPTTGLVYIFNLIVGTGALTIPKAFNDVGYVRTLVKNCSKTNFLC